MAHEFSPSADDYGGCAECKFSPVQKKRKYCLKIYRSRYLFWIL